MHHEPVIAEVLVAAPLANVWSALTTPAEMKQWYFEVPEFRAEPGALFSFTGGTEQHQYLHLCRVTQVKEPFLLAHTWQYDGYPGDTAVAWQLSQQGGGTLVTLTHSGLETFPADNLDFARKNFEAGWKEIVTVNLKKYLESNPVISNQ